MSRPYLHLPPHAFRILTYLPTFVGHPTLEEVIAKMISKAFQNLRAVVTKQTIFNESKFSTSKVETRGFHPKHLIDLHILSNKLILFTPTNIHNKPNHINHSVYGHPNYNSNH